MILAKVSWGLFVRTFTAGKTKTNQRILTFMFHIWLLEYILATRSGFVHCLIRIQQSNESLLHQHHHQYVMPVCVHDNSYKHADSTQTTLGFVNYMNEEDNQNENDRKIIKANIWNPYANVTKLAMVIRAGEISIAKKAMRDVQKTDNMRQYKNILDLIELFLCLLIAICVELIPLAWKYFRQRQEIIIPASHQDERRRQLMENHTEGVDRSYLKFGNFNWKGCKRKEPNVKCEKEKSKNALLAIGERNFTMVILKLTNRTSSRLITRNTTNLSDAGKSQLQQYKLKSSIQDRYNHHIKADEDPIQKDSCYKRQQNCCCCSCTFCSQCCFHCYCCCYCCCCCCCCCCFNACNCCCCICCYCYSPVCSVCGYTCCYCSSNLACSKSFCCCTPIPMRRGFFTYAQKPTPMPSPPSSPHESSRDHTRGRNNNIIENLCYYVYEFMLDFILKICCSPNKIIYHQTSQQQQQQKRHQRCRPEYMVKKKHNLCNGHALENCTSNYQQLKANIVCKFFCNNRKRQRRRRRKRRRRCHALNNSGQDCHNSSSSSSSCSNRNNTPVINCPPAITIDRSIQQSDKYYEQRSMFGQCFHNFKNAFNTIKKFRRKLEEEEEVITKNHNETEEIPSSPQYTFRQQTTGIFEDDSHLLIKIVRQSHAIQQQTQPGQNQALARRVYYRGGLRGGRPNLVWIFIGLVWFESSRLVDCYLHRQKFFENSASPLTAAAASSSSVTSSASAAAAKTEELQILTKNKYNDLRKCLSTERYIKQRKKLQLAGSLLQRSSNNDDDDDNGDRDYARMYENRRQWHPTVKDKYLSESSLPNDEVRLESIKSQILSKLGLTGRPNVSHPLPKEFIWDTLYRVDELGTMLKNFDFAAMDSEEISTSSSSSTWSLMDNYGRQHTVQVRVQSNSTHAHQSYKKYSEQQQKLQQLQLKQKLKQPNSVSPHQLISQNTRDNLKNPNPRNRKNNHNNKNNNNNNNIKTKLTYLSGMEVPKYLASDPRFFKENSPRQETETETFGLVVSDQHSRQQQEEGYLNDRNPDGYLGRTEEIIAFAEEGQLYSQHRILEFSTKTEELIQGKLFVRKAEIHLRIDNNKNNRMKHDEGGSKLKIWIFRMVETNDTNRASDQQIRFCAAFNIDTRFLGWKKLDITETVHHWLITRRTGRAIVSEKLRLLIDCTGCGDHYRLHLFDNSNRNQKENITNIPREVIGDVQNESRQKGDAVTLWLRQQQQQQHQNQRNISSSNSDPNPVQYHNIYKPFLVIRAEVIDRSRRVRRRTMDCSGALHGQCCKESFYVSFKALGWDDWIIAPRGYFANYCRGDCTGPFRTPDTFQTFHAHFIEEYRKMGLLNGMKPCCAPIKFSSMSLIYYGDNGIIKRDLPKMVVDECGCP